MVDIKKELYCVACLRETATVQYGAAKTQEEIPLCWAEGMVGAIPVFDNREDAERYANGMYEVVMLNPQYVVIH